MKFHADITNGKFIFDDEDGFLKFMRKNEGKQFTIEVKKRNEKGRSLDQNNYLYGVVYDLISDYTGETKEDLNEYFIHKFSKVDGLFIKTYLRPSEMNTTQFNDYHAKIRNWAWQMLNIFIPLPNEDLNQYINGQRQ